jgi:hypothetical protein
MGNGSRAKEVKSNITDNESCKMKTSKGTIQGYNGIATADSKHQIIIDAQAIGEGQEQHVLQSVLARIKTRYQRWGVSDDIYADGLTVTADTGYSNKENIEYLYENGIDAYVPDNQFRQRDPAFEHQKDKHKPKKPVKKKHKVLFEASDFHLDSEKERCICPAGESLSQKAKRIDNNGNLKLFFKGRLSQCRNCLLKHQCMRHPESADTRTGHGRQVSFIISPNQRHSSAVQWMRQRVDSIKGKQIYSRRLETVEPVFGNIRSNKGLDRFSLRGKDKVDGQWKLFAVVHNIEKINHFAMA